MFDLINRFYSYLSALKKRAKGFNNSFPIFKHNYKLSRLGTSLGGWCFVENDKLKNSVIISAGLGEDASFDIEFASKYGARVIMVDPTPRAIKHFRGIYSRLGLKNEIEYFANGAQPLNAYDLTNVFDYQLIICEKALWNVNKTIRFYLPSNSNYVSHSIINFQNNYSTNSPYINVEGVTIDNLLKTFGLNTIEILKLDIEGAEVEVLKDMLKKQIYPNQILVEFDELSMPCKKSKKRIESAHFALIQSKYTLLNRENMNFTYIRNI